MLIQYCTDLFFKIVVFYFIKNMCFLCCPYIWWIIFTEFYITDIYIVFFRYLFCFIFYDDQVYLSFFIHERSDWIHICQWYMSFHFTNGALIIFSFDIVFFFFFWFFFFFLVFQYSLYPIKLTILWDFVSFPVIFPKKKSTVL